MRHFIFSLLIAGVVAQGGSTPPTSPSPSGPYTSQVPNIDVCGSAQGGVKCPGAGSNGYFYRCCSSAGHCGPKNDVCVALVSYRCPSHSTDARLFRSKTRPSTAVQAARAASAIVPSPRSPRHTLRPPPRLPTGAIPAARSSTPSVLLDSAALAATFVVQVLTSAVPPTGANLSGVLARVPRCCKVLVCGSCSGGIGERVGKD